MDSPKHAPSVVLHEERLTPAVETVAYRRVRIAKRVVSEERTVTVTVRREELVVEDLDVAGGSAGELRDASEPLVLVLSEEVPEEVRMRVVPTEIVRVHVDRLSGSTQVTTELAREHAGVLNVDR